MDPSPTIPTSFVPKQPVKTVVRRPQSGTSVFSVVALFLFALALVGSAGVFGFQKYLENVRDTDAAKLEKAQQEISQDTVSGFIRTRDRFTSAKAILNAHVAFSQYLDSLEANTLQNVRFTNLTFDIAPDGKTTVAMSGVARSFNALASESAIFTGMKELKRAIFSGITVNPKDASVLFGFTAEVDPTLITANGHAVPAFAPATTTATTTLPVPVASTTPTAPAKAATTTP